MHPSFALSDKEFNTLSEKRVDLAGPTSALGISGDVLIMGNDAFSNHSFIVSRSIPVMIPVFITALRGSSSSKIGNGYNSNACCVSQISSFKAKQSANM